MYIIKFLSSPGTSRHGLKSGRTNGISGVEVGCGNGSTGSGGSEIEGEGVRVGLGRLVGLGG